MNEVRSNVDLLYKAFVVLVLSDHQSPIAPHSIFKWKKKKPVMLTSTWENQGMENVSLLLFASPFYPVHRPYYRRRIRDRIAKVSVPRVCSVRPLSEHNIIITDHARRYDEFALDSNSFLRVRAAFLKIITFRKSWVLPCAVLCVQYPTRTEHPIPSPWRRFAVCRRPFKRC